MHCHACELLLEKKLSKFKCVKSAEASLSDKSVTITYQKDDTLLPDELNPTLQVFGYTLSTEPIGNVTWDQLTITKAVITFIFLAILFMIFKSQGYLGYISVSESSTLPAFFIFGLVAGISSCAALVGGLLLSLSKQWNTLYGGTSFGKRAVPFAMFNIGRLISYALLGGLLGLIGKSLQISIEASSGLILIVSVVMIVIGFQMLGAKWALKIRLKLPSLITNVLSSSSQFQGKYMPFLAGAGTFFLPCGFTLLTQTIALTTGSFVTSSLIMLLFAFGTLPSLSVLSFSSIKFQSNPTFASTFNLVIGLLIIAFGFYNINSQFVVLGLPNASLLLKTRNETIVSDNNSHLGTTLSWENGIEKQIVRMKAKKFEYFPKSLELKANIPTTLTIENDNVVGCAQAMYLHGLYDEVVFLNETTATIEFTPKAGTYYISCSMGMVEPVIVTVT